MIQTITTTQMPKKEKVVKKVKCLDANPIFAAIFYCYFKMVTGTAIIVTH